LLPLYLAGVVFYLFRERIQVSFWLAISSLLLLLGSCWLRFGLVAVFPFAGTYLVFYLAFASWLRLENFGRFGDFSYGTYLYAFPIMQLAMQGFGHPVAPLRLFVVALPVTLLIAVASWYGVERRFLRAARRKETIVAAVEREIAEMH
jgi:peptidoglycan/LPS O-acetylase OafA/YrhL